jgi:outer membrane protein assembly factor BamB
MIRRLFKFLAWTFVALIATGLLLYAVGFRIQLDGGGMPGLVRSRSDDERAEAIARHRAAQRAGAPASVSQPSAAPAAASSEPSNAAAVPAVADGAPKTAAPTDRVSTNYWTDFRGPARDGHFQQVPIKTDWPQQGLKPIWKQPVGAGYASFVIASGRAFTIEQRGPNEVVAAYDVVTGRELWTNSWTAAFREAMGGDGPRATPVWSDGRLYALGAEGELRCLDDATGKMLWRTNILEDAAAANIQWGVSASPLVVDTTIVVVPGGRKGSAVAAYDRATGKRVWSALDDQAAYSSPMLVTLGGVRQLLVFTASRLVGLTPTSGELLWEFPWKTQFDINASQPLVIGDNRVFLSSGYGTGAAVIELTPAASGFSVREVWRNSRMKNQFSSSVLHEGFIYGLDESILACIDAVTGDPKWKGGRYGYGQVMLASGHLIVLTESGELALVRATPTRHEEIARFPVLDGKTWNHPAMSDGYLLVRNINEMAAFDLRK